MNKLTQQQREHTAQQAYGTLAMIADRIIQQHGLGTGPYHAAMAHEWLPLHHKFVAYVHKHGISKHIYR